MWNRNDVISASELQGEITQETVKFAERFGTYLADKMDRDSKPLTTSQLRKFFGEVKRQQLMGYDPTNFVMLKPKLAYAVGRAKQQNSRGFLKIEDFYYVLADAIDKVEQAPNKEKAFKNFITAFEAIVAYHKASEK